MDQRAATGRAAQRAACSNGHLVRFTATVFLNVVVEWALFLGVLVYAFDQGGSAAAGHAAISLLLPYVLFAPVAGAMAQRYPPQRVRLGAMTLQTLAVAVAAFAAAAETDPAAW